VSGALRRRGVVALRVLVSAALLAVVLAYANAGDVVHAVRHGEWGWFIAALGLTVVAVVVGGIRWWIFLEGAEIDVSRRRAIRAFAASLVLNSVLPTSVGGDAVRAWLVGKESGRLLGAAAATVVDKATALACLFLVGWATLAIDAGSVPNSVIGVFAWVTIGGLGVVAVGALAAAGVRPVLHRLPRRLALMIREVWATLRVWAASKKLVASVLGLGVTYQVLAVLALVLVGKTIGIELSFALASVSAAIVLVATLIPVSIGGLGVREGGFVLLLGQADIDGAKATTLSLLAAALIVLAAAAVMALAAVADLRSPRPKARAVPRQPSV
jgi:glycosyltransferase 2 family protein